MKNFLDAENQRNWIIMVNYLDDNIEYTVTGAVEPLKGRENYIKKMKATYSEIPDWRFEITTILSSNQNVVVEFMGDGHYTGFYEGANYTNKKIKLNAVCIFTLDRGKIKTIREYWDPISFKNQISHP